MSHYEQIEINELLSMCRGGDDGAFAELVRRYTPMMRKEIAAFSEMPALSDELFSEACVALHSAAMRYDLEQSDVTFGLYAGICVRHRMIDMARSSRTSVSDIDTVRCDSSDGDGLVGDIVARETFDMLMKRAEALLTDYEYRVLILHIQGYQTAAIAKALERTPKSVDNAKFRLFRRLRDALGGISDIH